MEATLHGVSGFGSAVRFPLTHEHLVSVGRSEQASVPISHDPALSGVHFTLEQWGDGQVVIRDLASTNGTFVNGTRIRSLLLQDGDTISAGRSVFKLQIQEEVFDPQAILSREPEPLYAILDAAREPRVLELLRSSGKQFYCLHGGKPAAKLELVAPYLVPFAFQGDLLQPIVSEGWGKAWGIFFTCQQPIQTVWQQLSRSLMVTLEAERKEVYFRFYDPRVLRDLLPILDAGQLEELGGPIHRFLMEDEEPEGMLRFTRTQTACQVERITVKPATTN